MNRAFSADALALHTPRGRCPRLHMNSAPLGAKTNTNPPRFGARGRRLLTWQTIGSTLRAVRCRLRRMNPLSNFVSLHPYFKVHPGKLEAAKALFPRFVEKTATEAKVLFYEFTVNGREILCREGYTDAEGLLAHLDNVGAVLGELLTMGDLTRIEVHG